MSAPKGKITRPTPDRVRESLFSILGDRVEGARVLALFAGTGCLGLECLSRGAAHGVFVEKARRVFTLLGMRRASLFQSEWAVFSFGWFVLSLLVAHFGRLDARKI